MCGLVGFFSPSGLDAGGEALVRSMAGVIRHRGPDADGFWVDSEAGIALGHRRLAIIDLSQAGSQPMVSASGRYVVAYNGEIYNFPALRAELEGLGKAPSWRGHSDTEILLAAIEAWGVEATLPRLNGMFAFALWDKVGRRLTLARDIIGEKPLYYGLAGKTLIFASELKALRVFPGVPDEVDREALHLYMRHNYIPAPRSIWRGIAKLEPGTSLTIEADGRQEQHTYWRLSDAVQRGRQQPLGDFGEASIELEALLSDAIAMRMVSDVPLGAFLSGGIDSSLIVALMQAQSAKPVKTFTIGYREREFDEAPYGAAVARHLGTDHHELYISARDGLDVIPNLANIWDEPFSDSSQIPMALVSHLTRQYVTVSLSGDAGDELFGGYYRYFLASRIWQRCARLPMGLRRGLAGLFGAPWLGRLAARASAIHPRLRELQLADRLPKVGAVLAESDEMAFYRRLVSHQDRPETMLVDKVIASAGHFAQAGGFGDFREQMMYVDTLTYLPDDILVKVDRASMAVSLESRVPFLDPRVIEFAWRLPLETKIAGGVGKRILRDILYRHVPRDLLDRPKMGFGVPIESWLRTELRDWAEHLLDARRLQQQGYFDAAAVRRMWDEHLSGKRRWHYILWDVLMFQAWHESSAGPAAG